MFRAKLPLVATFISAIFIASLLPANAASIAGTSCTKFNSTKTIGNIKFTCIKSGKKLIWNKGVVSINSNPEISKNPDGKSSGNIPSATSSSPSAEPQIPTIYPDSFSNLISRSSQISYAAWKRISDQISASSSTAIKAEIYVGPNTIPWNKNIQNLMDLTLKAIPNAEQSKSVVWILNNYQDLNWARNKLNAIISAEQLRIFNQNEGGDLFRSNCDPEIKNCLGSKELTTQDDIALVLVGVSNEAGTFYLNGTSYGNPGDEESKKTGQLLVHEYFHSFQRQVVFGKPIQDGDWPPEWVVEGSAVLMQNAVVNHNDFSKFMNWRKIAHGNRFYKDPIDYEFLMNFLDVSKHKSYYKEYDGDYIYYLGSRIMEALVAVGGPQSMLDIWSQMAMHVGFAQAFQNVYGISYEKAMPILAQAVSKNILVTK